MAVAVSKENPQPRGAEDPQISLVVTTMVQSVSSSSTSRSWLWTKLASIGWMVGRGKHLSHLWCLTLHPVSRPLGSAGSLWLKLIAKRATMACPTGFSNHFDDSTCVPQLTLSLTMFCLAGTNLSTISAHMNITASWLIALYFSSYFLR